MSSAHPDLSQMRAARKRRLTAALSVVAVQVFMDFAGGWFASSLTLIAEAVALLAYGYELAFAYAVRQTGEPAGTSIRQQRLATVTLVSCALLLLGILALAGEAYSRALSPPVMNGWLMLVVALTSMTASLVSRKVLGARDERRGELWTTALNELFGPAQLVVAASFVALVGWSPADLIFAVAISIHVASRIWVLGGDALHLRSLWSST